MTATLAREPSALTVPAPTTGVRGAPASWRLVRSPQERVRQWGATSVSPFTLGPDREVHGLASGGLVGFVPRGRWAVMAGDPIAPPGQAQSTLDEALAVVERRRLRPMIVAAASPAPYVERGLWTEPIADDALIDLTTFSLAGGRMANLRHSVAAGRRTGLRVAPWSDSMTAAAADVSAHWLATKRGGEMGFTLGPFDPAAMARLDGRVVLDATGRLLALTTWHTYDDGRARVLDLMRRDPGAPCSTMDLLIAQSLHEFAKQGVTTASLGSVPRSHGMAAERLYPTISLRRYKEKFAPRWEPRYLVTPRRRQVPAAMLALAKAYSPDGLLAGCRRNG